MIKKSHTCSRSCTLSRRSVRRGEINETTPPNSFSKGVAVFVVLSIQPCMYKLSKDGRKQRSIPGGDLVQKPRSANTNRKRRPRKARQVSTPLHAPFGRQILRHQKCSSSLFDAPPDDTSPTPHLANCQETKKKKKTVKILIKQCKTTTKGSASSRSSVTACPLQEFRRLSTWQRYPGDVARYLTLAASALRGTVLLLLSSHALYT